VTVSMIEKAPNRFVAHELALRAAVMVFALVENTPRTSTDLADQARRAAASVALNLAEGAGRAGKDRLYHFRIAYGSLRETDTAVRLLIDIGAVAPREGWEAMALLDRIGALVWKLMGRPGR
jgi:four helix bundle protein